MYPQGNESSRSEATAGMPDLGARMELTFEVQQFLFEEARALDEERYEDWLAMLTPDIHYWMPGIQARYRADERRAPSLGAMAYFDDTLEELGVRVARTRQKTAWAEDPPTRHCHLITNVEVQRTDVLTEFRVHSCFVNVRNRNEIEEQVLYGRREDLIRRTEGGLKLARRAIYLRQAVLLAKNLNTFL